MFGLGSSATGSVHQVRGNLRGNGFTVSVVERSGPRRAFIQMFEEQPATVGGPTNQFPLPFDQGVRIGGEVIYEEPPLKVRDRRLEWRTAGVVVSMLISFAGVLLILSVSQSSSPLLTTAGGAGFFAIGVLITYFGWKEVNRFTPFRVSRNGISVGEGPMPYFPFSEVACIEEVQSSRRFRIPLAVITFRNGQSLMITKGPYSDAIYVRDYEKVRDALKMALPWGGPTHIEWNAGAAGFLARLDFARGPFCHQIEERCTSLGISTVGLELLRKEWKEAAQRAGGWTYYSALVAAKQTFGRGN